MRKGVIVGLILAFCMILVSAVYAHSPGGGYGLCQFHNVDLDTVKKFQKETLPLRDELITKKIELRKEFSKANPDRDYIAALQKEIIDIKTQIGKKADEAGVPARKHGKMGCGRMLDKSIINKCQNPMGI